MGRGSQLLSGPLEKSLCIEYMALLRDIKVSPFSGSLLEISWNHPRMIGDFLTMATFNEGVGSECPEWEQKSTSSNGSKGFDASVFGYSGQMA